MNSILKFASVLALCSVLCYGALAQSSDETKNKTCCKGKGDKATCCQTEACQRDSTVATTTVAPDGLSKTIACGCCQQGGASATAPIILALDIDKDGIVSASEIKNATQSLLALDKNQDGKLDRAEMHANTGFSKVNASSKVTANKAKRAKTTPLIIGADENYFAQRLLKSDANNNNILEEGEIQPNLLQIMHIVDLNEDGQLSLNELKRIQRSIREYNEDFGNSGPGG